VNYNLRQITEEIEFIEEETDRSYNVTIDRSLIEKRYDDDTIELFHEIECVTVDGTHISATFYEDEIELKHSGMDRELLIDSDRELLEYTEDLK